MSTCPITPESGATQRLDLIREVGELSADELVLIVAYRALSPEDRRSLRNVFERHLTADRPPWQCPPRELLPSDTR